jgi:hypothetical protein
MGYFCSKELAVVSDAKSTLDVSKEESKPHSRAESINTIKL